MKIASVKKLGWPSDGDEFVTALCQLLMDRGLWLTVLTVSKTYGQTAVIHDLELSADQITLAPPPGGARDDLTAFLRMHGWELSEDRSYHDTRVDVMPIEPDSSGVGARGPTFVTAHYRMTAVGFFRRESS